MSQPQSRSVITIDPPLPCGLVKSTGICGKPAHKGRIQQSPKAVGKWVITPICRDCSAAALSLLWGVAPVESRPPAPPPTTEAKSDGRDADVKPAGSQPAASLPQTVFGGDRTVKLRKRYAAQFINHDTGAFQDSAYWSTERQAAGYVLMTIGSNAQIKAGRVFDRLEQCVVGDVHYRV